MIITTLTSNFWPLRLAPAMVGVERLVRLPPRPQETSPYYLLKLDCLVLLTALKIRSVTGKGIEVQKAKEVSTISFVYCLSLNPSRSGLRERKDWLFHLDLHCVLNFCNGLKAFFCTLKLKHAVVQAVPAKYRFVKQYYSNGLRIGFSVVMFITCNCKLLRRVSLAQSVHSTRLYTHGRFVYFSDVVCRSVCSRNLAVTKTGITPQGGQGIQT